MKLNGMCPFCYIKKILHLAKRVEAAPTAKVYDNGVSKTPIMGWSSWNTFKNRIDENLIYETALALKNSGLADAGYKYVNIDDCWQSNLRDENGDLQGDLTTFASGMPALIQKINALGIKVGLYTSNGTLTCEDLPASLHRERADAYTMAKWGVEYFKYDFCHNESVSKYAPLIYAITISEKGSMEGKQYLCSNAILKGLAKRMHCKALPGGKFVSGLDAGKGAIMFDNINVEKGGEYILTVDIKKKGRYEKFLIAKINGKDVYQIEFPSQKHFNLTARFQVPVSLKTGVNTVELFNPVAGRRDSEAMQYQKMGYALKDATMRVAAETGKPEKPIIFSICEWGMGYPWLWGASAGNMWRTTPDIRPTWASVMIIYECNVRKYKYAQQAHFNDPDMLEVGNGNLTYDENVAHFALWCMMASPLVLGNDVRKISKPIFDIVTDKKLIAINQDALCKQAKRVKTGLIDILAKPLSDGRTAVCIFNKGLTTAKVTYDTEKLVRDAFVAMKKGSSTFESIVGDCKLEGRSLVAKLPKHGAAVVII